MNFLKLVNEVLLLEDPNDAYFGNLHLSWDAGFGRCFMVQSVKFPNSKNSILFYSLKSGMTHDDLMENVEAYSKLSSWNCYPSSFKEQMVNKSFNINVLLSDNLPSGRYWIKDKKFFVSMWKGSDSEIKFWLDKVLPVWNPKNFEVYYQHPGQEDNQWSLWKDLSSPNASKESPEIDKLQKELNKLLPDIHIKTGIEKQKTKIQIQNLQKRIRFLRGETPEEKDKNSPKKISKDGQIAKDMTIAQMRALSQTSESFNDF